MSTLTISNLQAIESVPLNTEYINAIALFRKRQNTPSELSALGNAYSLIAFYFEQVRNLVGETADVDYGDTTPEGLIEYITDRATAATAALATAEAAEDFEHPSKGVSKTIRWYGASGSGS